MLSIFITSWDPSQLNLMSFWSSFPHSLATFLHLLSLHPNSISSLPGTHRQVWNTTSPSHCVSSSGFLPWSSSTWPSSLILSSISCKPDSIKFQGSKLSQISLVISCSDSTGLAKEPCTSFKREMKLAMAFAYLEFAYAPPYEIDIQPRKSLPWCPAP